MNIFEDQLIDMIWSVDAALDEILSDAKVDSNGGDATALDATSKTKARKKEEAERDKEILQTIVKRLLVRTAAPMRRAFGAYNYAGNSGYHSGIM